MKKKIYIILPMYFPVPAVRGGAVETLVEQLINENEEYGALDITLFSIFDEKAKMSSKKYKNTNFVYIDSTNLISKYKYSASKIIHRLLNERPYFLDDYHNEIYKYIKEHDNADFVIVEGGSDIDEFKRLSKLIGREKMILHTHCASYDNKVTQRAAKIFNKIVSVSRFALDTWNNSHVFNEAEVLYNGIDLSIYNKIDKKEIEAIRDKYNFHKDDFVILFCGRLTEDKGVKELIQAVLKLNNKHIKLLIVGSANGEGANVTSYQKEIERLSKDNEGIKFTGFIHNSKINELYSSCQCVAIPSICEDAFPLVKLEAMASRKPIIATISGGIPEGLPRDGSILIEKSKESIVDNLVDAILKLYTKELDIDAMGELNLQESENFSKENYYFNFLQKVS